MKQHRPQKFKKTSLASPKNGARQRREYDPSGKSEGDQARSRYNPQEQRPSFKNRSPGTQPTGYSDKRTKPPFIKWDDERKGDPRSTKSGKPPFKKWAGKKWDDERKGDPRSTKPGKPPFKKSPFKKWENKKWNEDQKEGVESKSRRPNSHGKPRFSKDFNKDRSPSFAPRERFPRRDEQKRSSFRSPNPARPILARKETLDRNSVFLWGLHAVKAAWLNPERRVYRLWVTESSLKSLEGTLAEANTQLIKRPDFKKSERQELDDLTPPGSVHQGVVAEVGFLPEISLHDIIGVDNPPDLLIMLDQITDPHNVGAIMRSAAAFGAGAVILTERNAPSVTGVLAKSASGALEHLPQIHVVNLARALDDLQEAGYWRVGLAEEGTQDLSSFDMSGRTVVVLGSEGEGLRQLTRKKCDELARLPTSGPIGALNVSNAAAVALYEIRRQKKPFGHA